MRSPVRGEDCLDAGRDAESERRHGANGGLRHWRYRKVDGEEGSRRFRCPSLAAALGAALSTWFAARSKSMPASAGQWWNDGGGTLAES